MNYGKGQHTKKEETYVFPGSSDDRQRNRYAKDMYDTMKPMPKNKTASGPMNTGIQGNQERGNKQQTQNRSESVRPKGGNYKSHYGSKAGSQVDNSVGAYDEYDYGKGRNKKGDQRKHVKASGG